jgi:nitroreductase
MENAVVRLLHSRHAGRSISPKPLAEEVVAELIEAVRLTPSCFNNQPWRYLFLESEEARARGGEMFSASNRMWASRAPLVVVGYSRSANDCLMKDGRKYHQFDLGMSAMNLILSATAHNLVARPMAGFDPAKIKELFQLEAEDEPLVVLAIGEPSEDEDHLPDYAKGLSKKPRQRKEASEIVRRL